MLTSSLKPYAYARASRTLRARHAQTLSQKALKIVPAIQFDIQELTAVYNDTRTDYIIPMPMTPARLHEYIVAFDIDLSASCVVLDQRTHQVLGLGMLGIRHQRSWITRLGVLSSVRGRKIGQAMMQHLILESRKRYLSHIWLEVIKNNIPAHTLFKKMGFCKTRELIIGRRAPTTLVEPHPWVQQAQSEPLNRTQILDLLRQRHQHVNWLIETETFENIPNLCGFRVSFSNGHAGWVVYEDDILQFKHVLVGVTAGPFHETAVATLHYLHQIYPVQDALVENIVESDPRWPCYQAAGYFESFRRIEMVKTL